MNTMIQTFFFVAVVRAINGRIWPITTTDWSLVVTIAVVFISALAGGLISIRGPNEEHWFYFEYEMHQA